MDKYLNIALPVTGILAFVGVLSWSASSSAAALYWIAIPTATAYFAASILAALFMRSIFRYLPLIAGILLVIGVLLGVGATDRLNLLALTGAVLALPLAMVVIQGPK